ncbi:MAG: precorrin-6A reductase [Clostridiales bacterium]|jgi:precorrin-6x reductase|nr:precorrin-6A reductase [Clostridiales bacterium]
MCNVLIFGGTTAGRELCRFCEINKIPVLYAVATDDGARAAENLSYIKINVGRLSASEMAGLIRLHNPAAVIDATHPHAREVSFNIASACGETGVKLIRITRESCYEEGASYFDNMDDLIHWLCRTDDIVFSSLGALKAKELTSIPDFKNRVWLRILPSEVSLKTCLDLGFPPDKIICMQGPFSQEMNYIMFKNSKAKILLTKDSGKVGGFSEKLNAARALNMDIAIIKKPVYNNGVLLPEAQRLLTDLCL